MTKTKFVASSLIRSMMEPRLPDWIEPHWYVTKEEALELAPLAEIGWFDMYDKKDMAAIITAATNLKWLNSIYAGVDGMPLAELKKRGTKVTNGAGINAITIAEYVVMEALQCRRHGSAPHTGAIQPCARCLAGAVGRV